MLKCIPSVLNSEELSAIGSLLGDASFVDGRSTAGERARRVKNNLQLERDPVLRGQLNPLITAALERNAIFRQVALPRRIHNPIISRYSKGMSYGKHTDDALMNRPDVLRTDLSVTVFLSDPDRYEGGELYVDAGYGDLAVKLPPGDAVIYPSTTVHRVAPVTRGTRLTAVTWVQSFVRDPARREILADLARVRARLEGEQPDSEETTLAAKTYSNLLRMWSEL